MINNIANSKLAKLEDYVFLSCMESAEVFIVERSGEVWRQDGSEAFNVRQRSLKNILFNWKNLIDPDCKWSWIDGWLPVLQIKNTEPGHYVHLLAKGDSLWVSNNASAVSYPDGSNVSIEYFEDEVKRLKKYWNDWLSRGWMPPPVHEYIDNGWKASLLQALSAYVGKHPRYGVGQYARTEHDGFPPTTLAMVSTLLDYKHVGYAQELLSYYLERYAHSCDGNLDYYGVSVSELGGLLILGAGMLGYEDGKEWMISNLKYLMPLFYSLVRLHNPVSSRRLHGLILGCPEADQREESPGAFFHNNAFALRAFIEWEKAMMQTGNREAVFEAGRNRIELADSLGKALKNFRNKNGSIPSRIDKTEDFKSFTDSRDSAYANYRYYPELLETGLLSMDDAYSIIKAREAMNGEFFGMTYMEFDSREPVLDDWPLASYVRGLIEIGDKTRFMNVFKNHILYHQTQDTFTAYEQVRVNGNPRRTYADWCVPCQLVFSRLLAWSFEYKKWDGSIVKWDGPQQVDLGL